MVIIMSNKKISMPQSSAGITRYFDESKSLFSFKPGHVIVLCCIVIVLIILLNLYGKSLFNV